MIEIEKGFSENELQFIYALNESFVDQGIEEGTVKRRGEFVRYEIYMGKKENNDQLILEFCVRDHEDTKRGCINFVHISNILVPFRYQRRKIATMIITVMSIVAYDRVKLPFFITGIVNEGWAERLISMGGVIDENRDIEIVHEYWMEKLLMRTISQ